MAPTLFGLIVCAGGLLFRTGSGTLCLQLLFCLFGAAAAVALPALGGATITPAVLFLPFLIARAFLERERAAPALYASKASVWLALAVAWGLLGAFYAPRALAGQTAVLTTDRSAGDGGVALFPLHPVSGNVTQSGYALGAFCAFVAVRALLARPGRLAVFRDAVLFLACLNCAAALINLAEFHLGLPSLLANVRTGSYAVFDAYEQAGLMRIQGTFSETSAFSAFTLPLFAFSLILALQRVRTGYSGAVAACSLMLLLFSTSGTAYVGLGIYLSCLGLWLAWRSARGGRTPYLAPFVVVTAFALLALGGAYLFELQVAQGVGRFFESTVLSKMQSASGLERSSWNQQAWSNFVDTYGLGTGLGSSRASSFPLVLLSNLGVVGTLCYAAFLTQVLRSGAMREQGGADSVPQAARHAVFAALAIASVSGAVFDLGVAFYAFAAAACVRPSGRSEALAELARAEPVSAAPTAR